MRREEAVKRVLDLLPEEVVVIGANGHVSRQVYALRDQPTTFYMIGSMGLASSIALGIALARAETRLAVLDGDGNVLMNLGGLASAGARRPRNFFHVCFDNHAHASTGGQRTISDRVPLEEVARAAGYVWAARAKDPDALERLVREAQMQEGPAFLLAEIEPGGLPPETPRVGIPPPEMARRVRAAIEGRAVGGR
jgi:thiamine pyrophosphate-dependent acetolactate synthase large subunit-like protein